MSLLFELVHYWPWRIMKFCKFIGWRARTQKMFKDFVFSYFFLFFISLSTVILGSYRVKYLHRRDFWGFKNKWSQNLSSRRMRCSSWADGPCRIPPGDPVEFVVISKANNRFPLKMHKILKWVTRILQIIISRFWRQMNSVRQGRKLVLD